MSVTIKIDDSEATLDKGTWSCEDKDLLKVLNNLLATYPVSPSDPDPDFTIAEGSAMELGGEVTHYARPKPGKPGVIY